MAGNRRKKNVLVNRLIESRTLLRDLDVHMRLHDLEYELLARLALESMGQLHKSIAPYMRISSIGETSSAQMEQLERLRKKHRADGISDDKFKHPKQLESERAKREKVA